MRILFISHFVPYPATTGASLRNFNILKEMSRTNQVHLLTFAQRERGSRPGNAKLYNEELEKYCQDVVVINVPTDCSRLKWYSLLAFNIFSTAPYSAWRFRSSEMVRAIGDQLKKHSFDAIHIDTIALAQYLMHLRGLPAVLNHHNVESNLLLMRAHNERNLVVKTYVAIQGLKLRKAEKKAVNRFHGNICVSELDRNELLKLNPEANVRTVPNGTDTEYFSPVIGVQESASLVFAGAMSWYPNRDAMLFFGDRIWPFIRRAVPGVTMNLIGSSPPIELVKLGQRDNQFKVLGFVDDVRPTIAEAAVYVVPIRVGGGTRLKILDAMAMGKAIVSHPIGAEGLDVTDGTDIVIAQEPEEFARSVIELLQGGERRQVLGQNARKTAVAKYSWPRIIPRLEDYYREIAGRN